MLKPLAKKSMVLPSPQSEWHVAGPTANGAALRIQQGYRRYQEKVRTLLKKKQSVQMTVTPVRSASMALAVVWTSRKDSADCGPRESSSEAPMKKLTHPADYRSDSATKTVWVPDDWALRAKQDEEDDKSETVKAADEDSSGNLAASSPCHASPGVDVAAAGEETEAARHGFVDIMHPSWLMASMEERSAQAAASIGASNKAGQSSLSMLDIRHSVLDLVFICRSGRGVNLRGKIPTSVNIHHQNLLARIESDPETSSSLSEEDKRRVTKIFNGLKSDMVLPAVRCLGWILTKTWRMLFHGLHVDVESLHRVRRAIEEAAQRNGDDVSVVFAPTHKTHLDYLIISYLCFAYGISLPRIAAGNNLDLPILGPFLRANGSFFIRRSFRDDPLYKQVLQQYVHELLEDGNPVEVFIEGGRSRHGRVCKPRLGFLSMFLSYTQSQDKELEDDRSKKNKKVLLVPIALDYDKVYEVEEYANQLLGKPKEKESLAGFFNSVWDILFLRCGHSYVRFGEPLEMSAKSPLIETAEELSVRMQKSGTITSTAIVAALLMWKRGYMTKEMLEIRTRWLIRELEQRGKVFAHVDEDSLVVHALAILKVKESSNGVLVPQLEYPTRALELGFYRNHMLYAFLPEITIAGAIDAAIAEADQQDGLASISRADVMAKASLLWSFYRHICRHDVIDLEERLDRFLLESSQQCELRYTDNVAWIDVDAKVWKTSKLVNFVLSMHWSFIDTLWLCTHGLWILLDTSAEITERDILRRVQSLAKALFLRKQVVHAEAFCSESMKQSLEFLEEQGFVRSTSSADGRSRILSFTSTPEELQALTKTLTVLRKRSEFVWKPAQFAHNLSQDEALALMNSTMASSVVYDKWMTAPQS